MTNSPADVDAGIERASILCDLRRYDEAIVVLQAVLGSCPDVAEGWAQLAVAHLGRDDPNAALQAATRASALAPDAGWPLRLISCALDRLGRAREAVLAARRAVAAEPYDWANHIRLGIALLAARKVREASAVADHAAAMAPNEALSHLLLADVARAQRRFTDAEDQVRQALAIDPASASTLSHLAVFELRRFGHLNTSRLARSAAGVADAIRMDPRDTKILARLDVLLTQLLWAETALVWLASAVVLRALGDRGSPVARIVPAIVLAIPVVIAVRTLRQLPPTVRGRLRTMLRQPTVAAALALEALAVTASLFAVAAPQSARHTAAGIAAGAALWAALTISLHRRHLNDRMTRPGTPLLSNGTLHFAAGSCWLLAVVSLAAGGGRIASIAIAAIFAYGGFAIGRYRRRRTLHARPRQ